MPPKSSKTTDRKPMKTALLETPDDSVGGAAVAAVAVAVAAPAFVAGGATVAAAAVSDTRILDKISRDRSSQELKYLAGLSMLEQKVCFIAQDHLESSFDLGRSSGFIAWKKSDGGGGGA
jgi:hypothetical protein